MSNWTERAKAAISQKGQNGTAKTDETPLSGVLTVSAVPVVVTSASPDGLSSVLTVPYPAVLKKHESFNTVAQDPDRWCWPYSSAMNGAEIEIFVARATRFTAKGLTRDDSDLLADRLVLRDRDQDDRHVCLECSHFARHSTGAGRCDNWQAAGIATHARDAQLSAALMLQLQRCDGFTA